MYDKLTDDNFLFFCAKHYNNPQIMRTEEFMEDINRIKYIKKLITRYVDAGELKEKLILNHIITLHNCFGQNLAKILYLKLEKQFRYVKPFLVMLNVIPRNIYNVGDYTTVNTDLIDMDMSIIQALRKITDGEKY